MLLDGYLPSAEDVEGIKRECLTNSLLKKDVEWYTTLYNIRGIKMYYRDKVMDMLKPIIISSDETERTEQTPIEDANDWITYEELVQNFHFVGVKNANDAAWRKKHNFFPCKQDGKGCTLRISVSALQRWLNGEKE